MLGTHSPTDLFPSLPVQRQLHRTEQRRFFEPLIEDVGRPKNTFTDGMKWRKRVLEVLLVAPHLEPKKNKRSGIGGVGAE